MAIFNKPAIKNTPFVAVLCIISAVGVSVYTFAASRADPGLRMAALVSMTNLAAALMATASTMLVGKDFTPEKGNTLPTGEFPDGTRVQQDVKTAVETPPLADTPPKV